jgi:hypothetical protein
MIVIVRLKDGAEVAGIIDEETEASFTLKDAMLISYKYDYVHNKPVVYLSRFSPFTKSHDVHFNISDITHIFRDLVPQFTKYYETTIKRTVRLKKEDVNLDSEYDGEDLDKNTSEVSKAMIDYEEEQEVLAAYEYMLNSNTSIH